MSERTQKKLEKLEGKEVPHDGNVASTAAMTLLTVTIVVFIIVTFCYLRFQNKHPQASAQGTQAENPKNAKSARDICKHSGADEDPVARQRVSNIAKLIHLQTIGSVGNIGTNAAFIAEKIETDEVRTMCYVLIALEVIEVCGFIYMMIILRGKKKLAEQWLTKEATCGKALKTDKKEKCVMSFLLCSTDLIIEVIIIALQTYVQIKAGDGTLVFVLAMVGGVTQFIIFGYEAKDVWDIYNATEETD